MTPAARPGNGRRWALAPVLMIGLMLGPVAAGLLGVLAPVLGLMQVPLGGGDAAGALRGLLGWPGLGQAARLSVVTGLVATVLSLAVTLLFVAAWQGTRAFALVVRLISPLLSVPHAAAALGLAFLIAPSGWISRALSPWATGWQQPPDLLILNDPGGLALIAGLVVKEVPFLLLMTLAALGQGNTARQHAAARSLGYGRVTGWAKVVLPGVYAQIRLPVYAVLAYSMSVVDMALILGPSTPPTLSVQILKWMNDPDLTLRAQAAAAALLQLALVAGALGLWRLAEIGCACLLRAWAEAGGRGAHFPDLLLRPLALVLALVCAAMVLAGLAGLAVWSVAGLWQFPDALPENWSVQVWSREAAGLGRAARDTALIALVSVMLAVALVIACLQAEFRHGLRRGPLALWLLYMPLIVPQVVFLPGLQWLALVAGLPGGMVAVIAAHLVFVLPYVFLALADPWVAWDSRAATVAASLGARPARVLWAVRLPMLLRPVLVAAAIGLAVSVGQYLPTLLIGGGRVQTLTTEAVALASGGNRRVIGAYALLQMALPVAGFALALAVPALMHRNRAGMRAGG